MSSEFSLLHARRSRAANFAFQGARIRRCTAFRAKVIPYGIDAVRHFSIRACPPALALEDGARDYQNKLKSHLEDTLFFFFLLFKVSAIHSLILMT